MTVLINKPSFNLREALTSLKRKIGIKGAELMAAETADDVYNVIGTNRNRIINGAMVIDQRNAGASVTASDTLNAIYTVDRWAYRVFTASAASKISFQRSSVAPAGFQNSMLVTSLSSYSIGSSDAFQFRQLIEGFNVADFGWGTANAKTVTLSFWVRSSLTGTFGGAVWNGTETKFYVFSYTINAANTWEYKTVTITGETTGTWNTTNSVGMNVSFSLGAGTSLQGTPGSWGTSVLIAPTGQVNVSGTNGATFYITGVQLEKGTVATPFEYRLYGTELALCQRYYEAPPDGSAGNIIFGVSAVTGTHRGTYSFKQTKRAVPTIGSSSIVGSVLSVSTDYVVIQRSNDNAEISGMTVSAEM